MCSNDSEQPAEHESQVGAAGGDASSVSRRSILQLGLAAGALAVAPPVTIVPLLPDPGNETPGPEPATDVAGIAQNRTWPAPPIVTRAQWGADESRRVPDGEYSFDSVVTKIVVHHTVTPNSSSDDAAVVRGIYNYHTSTGYIDIAYNFLIGRDGRIYEGRWSGTPIGENALGRNVRAAHSTATNTQSIGVALLGDYRSARPTDAQLEALAVFLAWKCIRWGRNPFAITTYYDGRSFPDISGHRDVTPTSCPGDVLHNLLPELRERAAIKMRTGAFGYWTLGRNGVVAALGDLPDFGDPARAGSAFPSVGIAGHPTRLGFWVATSDGGVFNFGEAGFYGSAGGMRLNTPVIGIAPTPSGGGYWLVAADGGIFTFGNAQFYGSTGNMRLNAPVIGMAPTPSGGGYWLVAADGGIFTFGNAQFYGSTGNMRLNAPMLGMVPTPSGRGYWLYAADGGIFTFGDAQFFGSTGGMRLNAPVVGMAATASGRGYWLVAADGGIFTFGDAPFYGAALVFGNQCIGIARRA